MTSHDFASHMVCFNKSNLTLVIKMASFRGNFELTSVLRHVYLLMNKVAVLVSHVKSINALREHQCEWLHTNLPDSLLSAHRQISIQSNMLRSYVVFSEGINCRPVKFALLIACTIRTTGHNTHF